MAFIQWDNGYPVSSSDWKQVTLRKASQQIAVVCLMQTNGNDIMSTPIDGVL